MRILIISTNIFSLPPAGYSGLEWLVYRMALAMKERGHEVTIMGPKDSRLPEGIALIGTEPNEPEEASWLRSHVDIEKAMNGDSATPPWDIIWDNTWEGWFYTSSIGRDPQLPIVHTFHAQPEIWGQLVPEKKVPGIRYPGFIGISESQCMHARNWYGVVVKRVYNGVDFETYNYKPEEPEPSERQERQEHSARNGRYLWLGRYSPEKGPLDAIQIARELRLNLTLVGDTQFPPDKQYIDRCFTHADGLQIRALPGVARDETINYYRTHKALVYPLGWQEPFGLVPVEAMGCGMPVLAYDRGSMREIIENGVNGYLCRDEAEMKEILRSGVLDALEPEKIRASVVDRFSEKTMADGYEELFKQFMTGVRW